MNNDTRYSFGGFYHPAFFRMNVPTAESLLNLNELPEPSHSFYFHEYLHFLQDVSTSDALANAGMVGNYLRYAVQQLKLPGTVLPLRVPPDAIIAPQQALRRLYLGAPLNQAQPRMLKVQQVSYLPASVKLPDGREPMRVELTFTGGERYDFGATWLCESMAYLAENLVYPAALPPQQVAYRAAELIVESYYPRLLRQSRLNVLALCDASLLFYHPGQAFFLILKQMRAQNWLPLLPEEVYSFAQQALPFDFQGLTSTQQLLHFSGTQAIEMLTGYFTDNVFSANALWIQEVIRRAEVLRQKHPHFMVELVQQGPLKTNPLFRHLTSWLGSPVTTNNEDESSMVVMEGFALTAELHPDLFRAIRQILLLFTQGQRGCEMRAHCQKTCDEQERPDFTDARCKTAPWLRSSDVDRCAYAVVWHMWGLTGLTPTFAPR